MWNIDTCKKEIAMNTLVQLKTNEKLLAQITSQASKKQSADEIRNQRVSFIFGTMDKSGVTRSRIQEVLTEQQGIGS